MRVPIVASCLAAACCMAPVLSAASGPIPAARCGAQATNGSSRNEGGSNSPKASTPIHGQRSAARPSTDATMSAKGSTPVRRGGGVLGVAGSGASSTAKASAPVAPRALTESDCSAPATR